MGRHAESTAALVALERDFSDRKAYEIAASHAYRGEVDVAFVWLDRANRQSKGALDVLKVDPMFRSLRGDSRFTALLRKLNLL